MCKLAMQVLTTSASTTLFTSLMFIFCHHKEIVTCTLTTFVPFLADAPSGWQVNLVDTPGFGEFNSHVEARAKEALKSSSASVYITTYENLRTEVNAKYLKLIHTHYQGIYGTQLTNIYIIE